MEDNHAIKFVKKDNRDYEFAYFGIFDGHGGPEASRFARDNLLNEITKYDQFWNDIDEDVLFAIKSGFLDTHQGMWKELGENNYLIYDFSLLHGRLTVSVIHCVNFGLIIIGISPRNKIRKPAYVFCLCIVSLLRFSDDSIKHLPFKSQIARIFTLQRFVKGMTFGSRKIVTIPKNTVL